MFLRPSSLDLEPNQAQRVKSEGGLQLPTALRWQTLREGKNTRLTTVDQHKAKSTRSYLFRGLQFENFCIEGRELYIESSGRVVHVTL